ncbi:MAG: hypothetical protein JO304_16385 [Solirubrobacterales bacterium]|nr:hypothetical protein [Solirubrobacterales bacterium]
MKRLKSAPYDLVLIDAPPLLASGEAQTLSTLADAVIVALADPMRMGTLEDLAATLSKLPVRALGFATVGAGRTTVRNRSSASGVSAPTPDRAQVTRNTAAHQDHAVAPPRKLERLLTPRRFQDELVERRRLVGLQKPPPLSDELGEP